MAFDMDLFLQEIGKKRKYMDKCLRKYMPDENTHPPVIHQAMNYAIFNGGKRLRPIMVLEGARLAAANPESVVLTACALEMIHSYSLVHDDLPAMDDDDIRRGKPTCHKVFGEANAILTGDALLTGAFELIAQNGLVEGISPINVNHVISEVAKAVGSRGMVGGQVIDLDAEEKDIDFTTLRKLHLLKTGELFKAALRAGAILGNMDEESLDALTDYAFNFGLAFQITDDILDVNGNQSELGKPVGSDGKNNKTTYVTLFGIEESKRLAEQSVEKCIEKMAVFGDEAGFLRRLANFTLHRNS